MHFKSLSFAPRLVPAADIFVHFIGKKIRVRKIIWWLGNPLPRLHIIFNHSMLADQVGGAVDSLVKRQRILT